MNLEKVSAHEQEKTKETEKNKNISDDAIKHLEMVQEQITNLNKIRKEISEISIKFYKK